MASRSHNTAIQQWDRKIQELLKVPREKPGLKKMLETIQNYSKVIVHK